MRWYTVLRGFGFVLLYFVAFPALLVALNERLGWPRWENALLEAVGTLLLVAGLTVCAYCTWLFWESGRGTPVPIDPPKRLVVSGLFRFSRHPMYVAYVAIAIGIFLVEGHMALSLYPIAIFLLAELYMRKIEEPCLVKRFGVEYEEYRRRVPRWPGGPAA